MAILPGDSLHRQHTHIRHSGHIIAPAFLLLHLCVSGTDEAIGSRTHKSIGMELITDGALGAIGNAQRRLVTEGIFMLVTAKFTPGSMELAGHAHDLQAQTTAICSGHGEMVIAPAASGQGFQFQMGVHIGQIPPTGNDMAAVVEHRKARLDSIDGFPHPAGVVGVSFPPQSFGVLLVCRIPAPVDHSLDTGRTVALPLRHNIQENTVRIVIATNFVDLGQQIVQVRGIHTQVVVARISRIRLKSSAAPSLFYGPPFRMPADRLFIKTSRNIHRSFDTDLMGCFDLGAQ